MLLNWFKFEGIRGFLGKLACPDSEMIAPITLSIILTVRPLSDIPYKDEPNAVEIAASGNDWDAIVSLINGGKDINGRDPDNGRTALMTAVFVSGYLPGIRYLLMKGAEVNSRDSDGDTALDLAKFKNNLEVCKLLERYSAVVGNEPSAEERRWEAYYDDMAKVNAIKAKNTGNNGY